MKMLELWNKGREMRALRALDAATALLTVGTGAAGKAVLQRLLVVVFECGAGGSNIAIELERAGEALAGLPADSPQPEPAARAWLAEAHRQRAVDRALAEEADPQQAVEVLLPHRAWSLHQLDPLARRIRLVHTATGRTAADVCRAAHLEGHLLARWGNGRGSPDAKQRRALARALGLAAGWLGVQHDPVPDSGLYVAEGQCPCGAGARRFAAGSLDGRQVPGAWASLGLWCTGCGQPYVADPDGRLYPVPVITGGGVLEFGAVADGVRPDGACGPELSRPWPHAHWYSPAGLQRRGALQIPPLYRSAPSRPPN
ncbi:hypothetical protein [Kitasatospora sp. NPDC086791]|uniref:hypothetical protein n=1 Tax=Kitasatospora sp. NPDC086791 TaxID=3155178 RepID=UPI00343C513C